MASILEIIITLKDKASGSTKKITKDVKDFEKETDKADKTASDFQKTLDKWKSFVGVGTSIVAAGVAIKKAFEFGKEGAAIEQTQLSFDNLIASIDAAPNTLEQLRQASRGTIDDMTLMSSTMTLVAGSSDEMAREMVQAAPRILEIAKAANKLNPELGDTAHLYESLMTGIKRGSPMLIDNTGLTLRLGEANQKMADSLGKSVEELTAEEKTMALLNATMQAGDQLINQVGGSVDALGDSYAQLEVEIKNTTDALKKDFSKSITPAIKSIGDWREAADLADEALQRNIITTYEWEVAKRDATFTDLTWQDVIDDLTRKIEINNTAVEYGAMYAMEWARNTQNAAQSGENFALAMGRVNWDYYRQQLQETGKSVDELGQTFVDNDQILKEMTGSMSSNLSELVEEATSGFGETAKAARESTREVIFNMLQQQMATNDLKTDSSQFTDEEINFLQTLGEQWGLFDETAVNALNVVKGAMDIFGQNTQENTQLAIEWINRYINELLKIPPVVATRIDLIIPQGRIGTPQPVGKPKPVSPVPPIFRQHGGPAVAGRPYIVGEAGPELFVPKQSGEVIPNQGFGVKSSIINLTYAPAVSLANQEEASTQILPFVQRALREHGAI